MGILRLWRTEGALLAAVFSLAAVAHAACTGPQPMVAQLRAHPTTDNAVLLGSWYAGHQQFGCALETFRGALKRDPKSAQLHYLTGLALMATKQSSPALAEIEQSVHLDGTALKPHIVLASLYDDAGRHSEAEAQWRQALAIDPKSEQSLEGLSNELIAKGDFASVVRLLRAEPRTERLSIKLAQALGLLNYLDDAEEVLHEAMQTDPNSLPLVNALTVVLVKQLKYEDAINLMHHAVETHPGNPEAEYQLFRLLVLTKHYTGARPMEPKILAERPHDAEALYLVGVLERAVGEYPSAKQHLEQSLSLDPGFSDSHYNLGMVLIFLHDWTGAKEHLEKAIALGSTEPEAHFELAKALRGLGDNEHAQEQVKEYQRLKHEQQSATQGMMAVAEGDKALEAGKIDDALRQYREATQDVPGDAGYHFKLAVALARAGDLQGQRVELEKAIQINPKLAPAHNALGYMLSRTGDTVAALEQFKLAVQTAPQWPDAWINLAAELATANRYSEAKRAVAKALELDPLNSQAKELNDQLARDPAAQSARP